MANLSKRWWMFNDWEKEAMQRALEYRLSKKVPLALLPFFDVEEVQFAVELYGMLFVISNIGEYYKLSCKLTMFPIMRLITYWVMGM